jgi:hypothetical protein
MQHGKISSKSDEFIFTACDFCRTARCARVVTIAQRAFFVTHFAAARAGGIFALP